MGNNKQKRVYLDTNVFKNYLSGENTIIPHSYFAFETFKKIRDEQFILIVSDWLKEECKKIGISSENFEKIIHEFNLKTEEVKTSKEDIEKTRKICRSTNETHYADALHAVLAIKAKTDFLVTGNIEHFSIFIDKIEILFPSDFLNV